MWPDWEPWPWAVCAEHPGPAAVPVTCVGTGEDAPFSWTFCVTCIRTFLPLPSHSPFGNVTRWATEVLKRKLYPFFFFFGNTHFIQKGTFRFMVNLFSLLVCSSTNRVIYAILPYSYWIFSTKSILLWFWNASFSFFINSYWPVQSCLSRLNGYL